MGCLDYVALGSEVGIALDDVPVEVRVVEVDCLSDGDLGLSCLDVDKGHVDCIHISDVNCISDVVVALFYLEVDLGWIVCIQVGCVVCIYDVTLVLTLDDSRSWCRWCH